MRGNMQGHSRKPHGLTYFLVFYTICSGIALANAATAWRVQGARASLERTRNIRAITLRPSLEHSSMSGRTQTRILMFESLFRTESFETEVEAGSGRVLAVYSGWASHGLLSELGKLCTIVAICGWVPIAIELIRRFLEKKKVGFIRR